MRSTAPHAAAAVSAFGMRALRRSSVAAVRSRAPRNIETGAAAAAVFFLVVVFFFLLQQFLYIFF
jgi:hypothetical protein